MLITRKKQSQGGWSLLELLLVLVLIGIMSVPAMTFIGFLRGRNNLESTTEATRTAIRAMRRNALLGNSSPEQRTFDSAKLQLPLSVTCLSSSRETLPLKVPVTTKMSFEPQSGNTEETTEAGTGWGLVLLRSEVEQATTAIYVSQRPGPVLVYKRYDRGEWGLMRSTVY